MTSRTEQQSFRDLLDEGLATNGAVAPDSLVEQKPIAGVDIAVVTEVLKERFLEEKRRLVDGLKEKIADPVYGLPTRVGFSSEYNPKRDGKRGFVIAIDPTGEIDPHAFQEWSFYVLNKNRDGKETLGHKYMTMALTVGLAEVDFKVVIGNEAFDGQTMKEIPEEEFRKRIVTSYLNPPAPKSFAKGKR